MWSNVQHEKFSCFKSKQAAYVVQFYERHILDTWIFLGIFWSIDICIDSFQPSLLSMHQRWYSLYEGACSIYNLTMMLLFIARFYLKDLDFLMFLEKIYKFEIFKLHMLCRLHMLYRQKKILLCAEYLVHPFGDYVYFCDNIFPYLMGIPHSSLSMCIDHMNIK